MHNINYCTNSIFWLWVWFILLMNILSVFSGFLWTWTTTSSNTIATIPPSSSRSPRSCTINTKSRYSSYERCPPVMQVPPPPWHCLPSLPIRKHCHLSERFFFWATTVTMGTIEHCRFTAKLQHHINYLCKYNLFPCFFCVFFYINYWICFVFNHS